jgi:hypothetical protein
MTPTATSQKTFILGYPKNPEFQNSDEYEVHQVGPKDAGSKNFSFLVLDAAKLSIDTHFAQQPLVTPRDGRNFFSLQTCF